MGLWSRCRRAKSDNAVLANGRRCSGRFAKMVAVGAMIGGEESGGYKGYGYATVVEILSAALQQGAFLKQLSGFGDDGERIPYKLGHFFLAINVEAFSDVDEFKKTTGDILRDLRASKLAPGEEKIFTCGEKEHRATKERSVTGIPLNDVLQEQMVTMRDELNLDYRFPFEN